MIEGDIRDHVLTGVCMYLCIASMELPTQRKIFQLVRTLLLAQIKQAAP